MIFVINYLQTVCCMGKGWTGLVFLEKLTCLI